MYKSRLSGVFTNHLVTRLTAFDELKELVN